MYVSFALASYNYAVHVQGSMTHVLFAIVQLGWGIIERERWPSTIQLIALYIRFVALVFCVDKSSNHIFVPSLRFSVLLQFSCHWVRMFQPHLHGTDWAHLYLQSLWYGITVSPSLSHHHCLSDCHFMKLSIAINDGTCEKPTWVTNIWRLFEYIMNPITTMKKAVAQHRNRNTIDIFGTIINAPHRGTLVTTIPTGDTSTHGRTTDRAHSMRAIKTHSSAEASAQ